MASLATPPPAAPVVQAPAAPTNMRDLLASLPPAETPPPAAEATPVTPPATPTATPEVTPPVEATPVTPAADTPVDAEPDLTQEINEPDSKSEDGKRYFYSESRAKTLHAGYNNWRQLHEVMPNLTVDGVKQAIQNAL